MNLELRRKFMIAVGTSPTARLPAEYQEVEYITIFNNAEYGYKNQVALKGTHVPISISFDMIDTLNFKMAFPEKPSTNSMIFTGWKETGGGISPYIYIHSAGGINDSGGDINFSYDSVVDMNSRNPFEKTLSNVTTTLPNRYISISTWGDPGWSNTINWYYIKMSKSGNDVVELIPCYRKSDNAVGFFDMVSGSFIPPQPTSNMNAFVAGGNV